jgi:hypothetical protein
VHGVEMLFAAMGVGCVACTRTATEDTDVVVGTWADGRVGTYRGSRTSHGYGGTIYTKDGDRPFGGPELSPSSCWPPMLQAVLEFFRSGEPGHRPWSHSHAA